MTKYTVTTYRPASRAETKAAKLNDSSLHPYVETNTVVDANDAKCAIELPQFREFLGAEMVSRSQFVADAHSQYSNSGTIGVYATLGDSSRPERQVVMPAPDGKFQPAGA